MMQAERQIVLSEGGGDQNRATIGVNIRLHLSVCNSKLILMSAG